MGCFLIPKGELISPATGKKEGLIFADRDPDSTDTDEEEDGRFI
jgi:hypothetical protein